jgi:hypothetical protein
VRDPDWIHSPVAAELEGVVQGFRNAGHVASHVTLMGLLGSWSDLVEAVETGYEDSVYEYANDVDSRAILDRVAAAADPETREALLRWLRPLDERYETATSQAAAPFHGSADASDPYAASRWHWRIPRRLEGELKSDLQAMGLA